jgi:hypothetical protein
VPKNEHATSLMQIQIPRSRLFEQIWAELDQEAVANGWVKVRAVVFAQESTGEYRC